MSRSFLRSYLTGHKSSKHAGTHDADWQWPELTRFVLLLLLLGLCLFFGGGSRNDIAGVAVVQPAAVLLAAASLLLPGPIQLRLVAPLLWMLAGLAMIMAIQLIPLPFALWSNLPGHGVFSGTATAAGLPQPWRPISISPDLTLASLAALSVPASVVIVMGGLSPARQQGLLPFLIGGALASAMLGVVQIAGGADSSLYMYKITNYGSAVGFFSNRNHQASLLVITIPMLALWARTRARDPRRRLFRRVVAGAVALALVPMLAVTGSRTGILLVPLGLILAIVIYRSDREERGRGETRPMWRRILVPGTVLIGAAAFTAILWRTEALERLSTLSVFEDQRFRYLPITLHMLRDFMPFGSGFGTFDPLFRVYEPFDFLRNQYFNHAHNDVLELGVTGGFAAYALLLIFLIWMLRLGVKSFVAKREPSRRIAYAQLGAATIILLFAASISDYPLRTSLMSALFTIACVWLAGVRAPGLGADRRRG